MSESRFSDAEYQHVANDLARYDSDSQKLASGVSLVLTAAFVLGAKENIQAVFPFVPLITAALLQYLVANNYAYRVRESYLRMIEKKFRGTETFPAFYSSHVRRYFFGLSRTGWVMLPFTGAVAYAAALVMVLTVYSLRKALPYLHERGGGTLVLVYLLALMMAVTYTGASAIWSLRKLKAESAVENDDPSAAQDERTERLR